MQTAQFILFLLALVLAIRFFNKWVDKVELEREYLQSLLREQEKDRNIMRKVGK